MSTNRRVVPRLSQERVVGWLILALLAVILIYPMWFVVKESFQTGRDDSALTFKWYRDLVGADALDVIKTTAIFVVVSSVLATVIGLVMAWLVERVDIPFPFVARLVPVFPLLIPGVMGAAAWAFLCSPSAGYLNNFLRELLPGDATSGPLNIYSLPGVIFVCTLYMVPFTYTIFYPAFRSMDGSLEEAAYIYGAGPFTAARTVTLGVVRPAIYGAVLVAFVTAMAQFTIPFMLNADGKSEVLTTRIYTFMQTTFPANIGGATATAMLALVPSLLFLALQYRLLQRGSYAVIGGKGGGSKRIRHPVVRWIGGLTLLGYAFIAFVLPMAAIIHVSVIKFWNGKLTTDGLNLDAYRFMWNESPDTWPAIRTSVLLGFEGATISTLLAFMIAYVCIRSRSRTAAGLDLLANIPAGIPATVTGVGFLIAFIRPPVVLYGTRWLLLLAYLVIFLPIAIRPISASIRQVSRELEDASRIAGASWIGTVRHVTLPLVLTSLLAGWALLFVMLTREVSASVFLVTAGVRLVGTTIFSLWTNGQNPQLAAFSVMVTLGSLVFVAFAQWVSSRQTLRFGWGRRGARAPAAADAPVGLPPPVEPIVASRVETILPAD